MTKKPTFKINYLLGVSKKGAYDSRNNVAVQELEKSLYKVLTKFEKEIVKSDLNNLEKEIIENLQRDLLKFMGLIITYFMRQKFSVTGAARTIEMVGDSFDIDGSGTSRLPEWKSEINKNPVVMGDQLIWPGLAHSTIARKLKQMVIKPPYTRQTVVDRNSDGLVIGTRSVLLPTGKFERQTVVDRNSDGLVVGTRTILKLAPGGRAAQASTYYFWWSGRLASEIKDAISNVLFGPGEIIDPTVEFTTTNAPGPFQRGDKLGSIKVRLFRTPSNARVFQPALATGDFAAAYQDQSLLDKFLNARVAEKLGPSRHAQVDNKRPWVGPSIAYWIIKRVPYVIEKSIADTITKNKSKRKDALDKVAIDSL